mmetsp:Transcript_11917/g.38288  ORF Transcript_11917/g.38288 Transcript_11917/m.38288 type:complete len:768 (+) Transcript_11917:85-2388(+)
MTPTTEPDASPEEHSGDSSHSSPQHFAVRLARTISGDSEGGSGRPRKGSDAARARWRQANTLIAIRRLQHGRSGAGSPPAGEVHARSADGSAEAGVVARQGPVSRPAAYLAFLPGFTPDLEAEYFRYSLAASRGALLRTAFILALRPVCLTLFLVPVKLDVQADLAGGWLGAALLLGRLSVCLSAAGLAAALWRAGRVAVLDYPATLSAMFLALLWCDGFLMTAADVLHSSSSKQVLLVLMHLLGYATLVPHLQARHATLTFWSLLAARLALLRAFPQPGLRLASVAIHDAVVNLACMCLACMAEAQNRDNFSRHKLLEEEEEVKVALRDGVQRLLLNTLPAPIVRDIASGSTQVAHRYDEVTVLQADMVGFTKLSSERSADFVLGLLSDLFAKFDGLAEGYGVHKVKTIGDAYIVCCGAFGEARGNPADAARRVGAMALGMIGEVQAIKEERKVDIDIRVGVHTGTAIGGIIGTVRFHFDIWGRAVAGALRLEELGAAGRVHVSDATANHLYHTFALSPAPGNGDGMGTAAEGVFPAHMGIHRTYYVEERKDLLPASQMHLLGGLHLDDEALEGHVPKKPFPGIELGTYRDGSSVDVSSSGSSGVGGAPGWMRSRGSLMSTGDGPRDSESKPSRLAEFISQQTGAQTAAPVALDQDLFVPAQSEPVPLARDPTAPADAAPDGPAERSFVRRSTHATMAILQHAREALAALSVHTASSFPPSFRSQEPERLRQEPARRRRQQQQEGGRSLSLRRRKRLLLRQREGLA